MDEEFDAGMYCVFGTESAFCYGTFMEYSLAQDYAKVLRDQREPAEEAPSGHTLEENAVFVLSQLCIKSTIDDDRIPMITHVTEPNNRKNAFELTLIDGSILEVTVRQK